MYSDKTYHGDDGSIATELLTDVSEIEQKCIAVSTAVSEGYFLLNKALSVYKVSEIEYIAYSLAVKSPLLKQANKEQQMSEAINIVASVFSSATNELGTSGRKALHKLQTIAEGVASL